MYSDPIADLLTRIRNASRAEHEKCDIPSSKLKVRIAELLKEEGFIKNFRVLEDKKQNMLRVYLKYGVGNEKMISGSCGCPRRGGGSTSPTTGSRRSSPAWAARSSRRPRAW